MSFGSTIIYCLYGYLKWRTIVFVSVAVALSSLLQSFLIPESNYWYLVTGDELGARKSLLWFQPYMTNSEMDQKIKDIADAMDCSKKPGQFGKFVKDLRHSKYLKPLLLGLVINFFRGGEARAVFAVYFVKMVHHFDIPYDIKNLTATFGVINFMGTLIVLPIIHKFRRKVAIYLSSGFMVACMVTLIAYKILQMQNFNAPWIPLFCICFFKAVPSAAQSALLPTILSEIQMALYRAEATSIHNGTAYIFTCLYSYIFPFLEKIWPIEWIVALFAANIVLVVLVIAIFVPETSRMEHYKTCQPK